jgi:hypothetical protein
VRKREREKEGEGEMQNMVALFLFLKGMAGALAPFSYLVLKIVGIKHILLNYYTI